ncbi:MAG TPA: carboxypeptidase-like regulatory domain-containing protein [Terriglobia bacterium]|nr:carboxypeptidase-like regulatory domain-containing protein [Terriglobia bacterium]
MRPLGTLQRLEKMPRPALAFVLAILFAAAPAAWAQSEAAITGVVTDTTGGVVPDASITVINSETGARRTILTDAAGRYEAPLLPAGIYQISASRQGFDRASLTLTLVVGQRAEANLKLSVAAGHQAVDVQDTPATTQVTTADASGVVSRQQVRELPLNGRSYDQLITLNPGVVNYTSQRAGGIGTNNSVIGNMFSASGRRPQENLYLLNGIEFTSASEINNTPGGASGQLLGVDAVREFSVVKDDYGAEFGKRPGAQINIVTASGTDQLHGNAYEFLRNSALDARNFFDHGGVAPFQRNVFGGSLGGPVSKDRTFLFGNYEGYRQHLRLSNVAFVPDDASRASAAPSVQPFLALWPAANGPELLTSTGGPSGIAQAFSNPLQAIREDFGTVRLDHTFSEKDTLTGVFTIDDSVANTPTANPLSFVDITLREQVASLSETRVFSPNVLNRATFGFSRGAYYYTGRSLVDLPGFVEGRPIGAVVIGGSTANNAATQIAAAGTSGSSNLTAVRNLFTAEDQVAITHGIHLFKFGVWAQRIQANDNLAQNQYGQATFSNLQAFLDGAVSAFTVTPSSTLLGWRSFEGAFYAEDVLKPKPSLELRLGFRAESTDGWNEAHGRAANYRFNSAGVIDTQPTLGRSALTVNNAKFLPSPRLGVAWSPFASRKTVVRAGFGLYYSLLDNLSYRLDNLGPYNQSLVIKGAAISSIRIAPDAPPPSNSVVPPSGVQPSIETPTVESYTLTIEQQLSANTSLSVGYVGSHAYHELLSVDANVPVPTICPASPCPAGYPAGTWYNPPGAPLANPDVGATTTWFSEGVSSYNALEVDFSRRFSRGLQFRGVYTFAKALDNGDTLNTTLATNSPAYVSNPLLPASDYGRASFDVRHSAVVNATWELPFTSGQTAQGSSWPRRLLTHWRITGIAALQSGIPFTPQLSYNPSNDGDTRNPVRPSWDPNFTGQVIPGSASRYFDPSAFIQPLPGTYGNAGRNVLTGPGMVETDVSLAKSFSFGEKREVQLRADFFNVLNHPNLNTPNPVVFTSATGTPSPTAGVVTSTSTSSRQIQLALKLSW